MRQIVRSIEPERQFDEDKLIFMLGEELKKPLTTIKAIAESSDSPKAIQFEAKKALRTIDNMLFFQALNQSQLQLDLTTIHIGATLVSVANNLRPLSIERGCTTQVFIQPGIKSVYTDPQAITRGIESLWQAVLGMTNEPSPLNWHVYNSSSGIKLAVTNDNLDLSKIILNSSKNSAGLSKQPFSGISGPATDLITAQGIFSLLGSRLSKISKNGQRGLVVTLAPSTQLKWI
jgi:hypothetical protein